MNKHRPERPVQLIKVNPESSAVLLVKNYWLVEEWDISALVNVGSLVGFVTAPD
jgi:hypothetical protein